MALQIASRLSFGHLSTKVAMGMHVKRLHFHKDRLVSGVKPQLGPVCVLSCRHKTSETNQQTSESQQVNKSTGKELDIARESPYAGLSMGEKVKEAGKDITYIGFAVAAIATLGAMAFYLCSELFSGESPNGVYSKALKKCIEHPEVQIVLGDNIKGYGETNRRGRRRHVMHKEYMHEGRMHMRMQFYMEGSEKKGTVHLEVAQDAVTGKYEYRYLFIQLNNEYPQRTIIIEDNR